MTPTDIQKTMNDAMANHAAGRLADAERLFREVLAQDPAHPQAAHQLGAVLLQAGRLDEAIAAYQRHLANWPEAADSWHNLGMAFKAKGLLAEAQSHVRKSLELQPDKAETHNTLGSILAERSQLDQAVEEFNLAVRLRPNYAKAYSNLGAALRKRGQCTEAVHALQKAVELDPQLVEAYNNLGIAFKSAGHLAEAAQAYEKALSLRPGLSGISNSLANVYKDAGQLDEAIACYRRALRFSPDNTAAHDNLIFCLHYHHGSDAAAIFREQRAWNERHAKPLAEFIRPHANDRSPERRLRVGYVSAFFYDQAEAFYVLPLLEAHDHEQFEIHCYACVLRPDEITNRHRRAADVWHDVLSENNADLAERIAADRIDVLVDLTMHMSDRLLTFARKPAPVQVTWLAYPGGTGLDAMDYRITDRYIDPEDAEPPCYSERSIRLPDCWCCYDPLTDVPAAAPRDGPAVTFGSINNPCKLNEPLLRLWARALLAVDNSRLLLQTISSEHSARITELMGQMGIGPDRLDFVGRKPRMEYLRFYDRIDIGLDPFPFNGNTTTLDALWMGVPVVSLAGQRAASRTGLSILKNAGLGELAAQTPEEFVKIAADLARDSDRRAELRRTLRRRLASSPLMDFKRFARNMESAYRQMWRDFSTANRGSTGQPLPHSPDQALELAIGHHQAGRLQEAERLYRQILTQQPEHAVAMHYLGLIAHRSGRNDDAGDLIARAIALNPNYADAHYNLGNVLKDKGQLDEAIAAYRRAIALRANFAEAHSNLGIVLKDKGQLDEAIAAFRQAIAFQPTYADGHRNLGNVLIDTGQLDEAIAAYRRAIAVRPNYAEAHSNLGSALKERGQLDEAIAAHRRAIALKPNYAEAHSNLGIALADKGQLDEAIAAFRRAIALNPTFPEAHNNLGVALKDKGQLGEAVAAYRQAIALRPNYAEAHSNLLYTLYFDADCSQGQLLAEHRAWAQRHAHPLKPSIRAHENDRDPNRRLRIGYVSPDFRAHPVGRFLLPLLAAHDHEHFEIFCYASVDSPDDFTPRIHRHADVWRDIRILPNDEAAELIRKDRIDILIDLSMHMAKNRMLLFARKPAPVQATYLAYAGTTGLDTIDYRITDPHLDPPDSSDEYYTERSIRLPETYWCYEPPIESLEMTPLPGRQSGFITFGCLNNFCKISAGALQTWFGILAAVPNSRLLLHGAAGSHRDAVREKLSDSGIDPTRLSFMDKLPLQQYMRQYDKVDIGLDSFPYVGGTTTCDALWMGVPVITLRGQTAIARGGASIMTNIGLPELIAESPAQYVQIAAELAADLPRLTHLRGNLREKMRTSPLMDAPRFARAMEAAYRRMWRDWCSTPA